MSDRKYRQRGYQDSGGKREPTRRQVGGSRPSDGYGPKRVQLPPSRTISRCAACGAILSTTTASLETCSGCGAALHACTQCAHFDPGSRFQCTQPIPEAIPDKNARNACDLYRLRTSVERDASRSSGTPASARSDFDALFKK